MNEYDTPCGERKIDLVHYSNLIDTKITSKENRKAYIKKSNSKIIYKNILFDDMKIPFYLTLEKELENGINDIEIINCVFEKDVFNSVARFENTFKNMIYFKFVLQEKDLEIINNISLEDFIRLNIVFRYLQNTDLSNQFIVSYIDKYLMKLDAINNIDNVDILINLYNLIKTKGTNKQMSQLKNKIQLMHMNELLRYLESSSYNESLK